MKKSKIVSSWLAFATELTEKKIYSIFNCRAVEIMLSLFIVTIVVDCVAVNFVVVAVVVFIVFFSCTQYNTSGEHSFWTVRFNLIKNCNLLHMNILTIGILRASNVHTAYYIRTNCSVFIFSFSVFFLILSVYLFVYFIFFTYFCSICFSEIAARIVEYEWNKKKTRREININSSSKKTIDNQ